MKKTILAAALSMGIMSAQAAPVTITWEYVAENMSEFRLYCREGATYDYTNYLVIPGGLTRSIDTDLKDDAVLTCMMSVLDEWNVESAGSTEVTISTKRPSPPTGLTIKRQKILIP